jgi:hypothetical protein
VQGVLGNGRQTFQSSVVRTVCYELSQMPDFEDSFRKRRFLSNAKSVSAGLFFHIFHFRDKIIIVRVE